MKEVTHKCSYYCNDNIHAIETLVGPHKTDEDIKRHFTNPHTTLMIIEYISHKWVNEVDDSFKERALQGGDSTPYINHKPVIVFVKWPGRKVK